MSSESYCLVLAGGGAKGVFHIGAWKALREIGVPVNAFVGNSIGAIVAAFLAQGKHEKLQEIGHQIGLDFVVNIPNSLIENGEFKLNSATFADFKKFYQTGVAKKGLDTEPLQRLLKTEINEQQIRASGNDLGVVTYNISDLKAKEVFVEDMEVGHLVDYLLASSAFPGFEQPEIGGKKYIDGGVYDNIPYNMARQRGYKRIIVVDISGLGVKRKLNVKGGQIIYVKNSINIGGVLDFNREFLDKFYRLGYLDTMKTFDRLVGQNYFVEPDAALEEQFNAFLSCPENQNIIRTFVQEFYNMQNCSLSQVFREIFPEEVRFIKNWLSVFVDCAATVLSIERIQKWTYPELFNEIQLQTEIIKQQITKLTQKEKGLIEAIIKERLADKKFVQAPYYYYLMIDQFVPPKAQKLLKKGLFAISPELAVGHLFNTFLKYFTDEIT